MKIANYILGRIWLAIKT